MTLLAKNEDALLWLVTEHAGTVTGEINADIAGWLLRLNTGNRSIKKSQVDRFIRILQRGMWVNTGEPVIVSREGIINDGQHRLTAIHESGVTAVLDVRFGIAREAFMATGTGSRRSAEDVLHILGREDAKRCSSIAKVVWHYDNGTITRASYPVESSDIEAIVQNIPAIIEVAKISAKLKTPLLRRAWFGGVLALIVRHSSLDEVRDFAELVDTGQGGEWHATRRLHERLVNDALSRAKIPSIDRIILAIKAWNAYVVDRPIGVLRIVESERTAKGFPIISPTSDVAIDPPPRKRVPRNNGQALPMDGGVH